MSYTYTGANLESLKSVEAAGTPTGSTALIPDMTSNTAPSGTASASTDNTNAWKTFSIPFYGGWTNSSSGTSWIQYQFGTGKTPTSTTMTGFFGNALPADLAGSNDGSSWTTLCSLGPGTITFSNSTSYTYFRWTFNNSGSSSIYNIQLYS